MNENNKKLKQICDIQQTTYAYILYELGKGALAHAQLALFTNLML